MKKYTLLTALLAILVITSACTFPTVVDSDQMVATEVQKALADILEETASAQAAATYTPYPTYTPLPTYTPQPTRWYPSYYDQYIPSDSGGRTNLSTYCNSAVFVSETIPDNTVFNPGETFTKTWSIRNTGHCTWDSGYKLVFTSGNSLSGVTSSAMPHDVAPGTSVVLTVEMKAPSTDGTYKGDWAIENPDGYRFARFWVQIKVR
ncbi:MAG: hypothetical protein PWQ55_2130 [Chloroflexota bacterium]|nr:hypothetical protein [Chloroflexota bacterium]